MNSTNDASQNQARTERLRQVDCRPTVAPSRWLAALSFSSGIHFNDRVRLNFHEHLRRDKAAHFNVYKGALRSERDTSAFVG
jgi:hypothetical protein